MPSDVRMTGRGRYDLERNHPARLRNGCGSVARLRPQPKPWLRTPSATTFATIIAQPPQPRCNHDAMGLQHTRNRGSIEARNHATKPYRDADAVAPSRARPQAPPAPLRFVLGGFAYGALR
jgi:hypothetical protein